MTSKHRIPLFVLLSALSAGPALAQPIESEPLGPAPYNLKNETDPMALDSSAAYEDPAPAQAPPADFAPLETAPPAPMEVAPVTPPATAPVESGQKQNMVTDFPPPPVQSVPAQTQSFGNYPNNPVTGLPSQTPKQENRVFCTLKVAFTRGADDTAVKTYLDSQGGKLTYLRAAETDGHAYCITVIQHRDKADIYLDLKKLLPPKTGNSPPVTLSGKGFTPVTSGRKAYRD